MRAEKINGNNRILVINLLKNVNGLNLENHIIDKCHLLLNDTNDIVGTISYEKYDKLALIRYFVFKRDVQYEDLIQLYGSLEQELRNYNIDNALAIINSEEVKEVFSFLGFNKIDKDRLFFDETVFSKTNYKDNDVYVKKIN